MNGEELSLKLGKAGYELIYKGFSYTIEDRTLVLNMRWLIDTTRKIDPSLKSKSWGEVADVVATVFDDFYERDTHFEELDRLVTKTYGMYAQEIFDFIRFDTPISLLYMKEEVY
jgi:hypothetical protein